MESNSLGRIFRLSTFGESHGIAVGGIIDGCPAGLKIDTDAIQLALDRRKPGTSSVSSPRKEADEIQFKSGIFEGVSTGTPIAFEVLNTNQNSKDYDALKDVYRPSHADFVYEKKYGIRDYRGGGRSSARETLNWVVAGEIARQVLHQHQIQIAAYVSGVGPIAIKNDPEHLEARWENIVRCPDEKIAREMIRFIEQMRAEGDSTGGKIRCIIKGLMPGLGEPVFDKLHARLAQAMMSINAVKAFEIGSGVEASKMRGSEHNDSIENADGKLRTKTNYSGGIQGGISNGEDVLMNIHFKPVASISKKQESVDVDGKSVVLEAKGRHDPCVVPRAVPIVEAMAALVVCDFLLLQRTKRL